MSQNQRPWYISVISALVKNFNTMHRNWRTFFIMLTGLGLLAKFAGKEMVEVVTQSSKAFFNYQTFEEKKEERVKLASYIDSLQKAEMKRKTELAFKGRYEIKQECRRLQQLIPNCITVSFWSIHNGGAELKIDNNWELDVNESSDEELLMDFDEDTTDTNQKIWDGLIYFGNKVKNEGLLYIPDVTKDPLFYQGKLRRHVNVRGLKAVKAMYVGNNGKNLFFVSFDFDKVDPKQDYPFLRQELRNFKRFVKERIVL